MSVYSAVMELAKPENRYYELPDNDHIENEDHGQGDWLEVLNTCIDTYEAGSSDDFAGAWVHDRTSNWFPGLSTLESYGLLEKQATTRAGQRAYWELRDLKETRKALEELGVRE